jgi:hypothetical protein
MADHADKLGATKSASTLLVLFIPSVDRNSKSIPQSRWVDAALRVLGELFGGATAFPKGRGVWRDDARGGQLVYDKPVVIHCYTSERLIGGSASRLREFLVQLGTETRQGAVGLVIDRDYLEIGFPVDKGKE